MNIALGGSNGAAIDRATLPQSTMIDYVRLYQQTDTTPPYVTATTPIDAAMGIATTSAMTATFSEAMTASTINSDTMFIERGGILISAAVSYDAATHTATLTPTTPLTNSTMYSVTVKGAAGGVADTAGNPASGDYIWAFTTVAAATGSPTGKLPAGTPIDLSNPLAFGFVALWHFDQGLTPVNLVNPALSGAYQGTPTVSSTPDGMGMAARSDADYLLVTDAGNVLNFTTGPFSIEVDFYYATLAPGTVLVGRDHFNVDGYNIQTANDGVGKRIAIELNHGSTSDVVQTGEVLTVGAVNRVLVTYSGSTVTIYVNGVSQATASYTPPVRAVENLFVGRDATFTGMHFNNPITRLGMWNRALTASEALQVTKTNPYAYMVNSGQ